MPRKSFPLGKEDSALRQFNRGLDAWERLTTASNLIRARRAVRVRWRALRDATARKARLLITTFKRKGAARTRSGAKPPVSAISDVDLVVRQFRAGLRRWERFH